MYNYNPNGTQQKQIFTIKFRLDRNEVWKTKYDRYVVPIFVKWGSVDFFFKSCFEIMNLFRLETLNIFLNIFFISSSRLVLNAEHHIIWYKVQVVSNLRLDVTQGRVYYGVSKRVHLDQEQKLFSPNKHWPSCHRYD